jgi:hypothetical protein
MALKVKLEKSDRYLCELTSWQPSAAPRIDVGNIKLAECRDFSTADTPYGESTNDRHSSRTIPSLVGSSVFPTTKVTSSTICLVVRVGANEQIAGI